MPQIAHLRDRKHMHSLAGYSLTLLLAIAWFAAGIYVVNGSKQEESLLQGELQNFIVPNVRFGGKTYEIGGGVVTQDGRTVVSVFTRLRVLRVAHAAVLNRLDPLFGMEGTDPRALAQSVQSLEQSKSEIAALYTEADRKNLEETLYPVAFLRLLGAAEEARQELITVPSLNGAHRYYQTVRAAMDEALRYTRQAERLYGTFPKDTLYHFLGGQSSPDKYVSALARVRADFSEKKTELRTRTRCLLRFSPDCPTLSAAFQTLNRRTATRVMHRDTVVPPSIFEHEAILGKGFPFSGEILTELVVRVTPSACEPPIGDALYKVQKISDVSGKKVGIAFAYLNDIYFFDVSREDHPFFNLLKEKGGRYLYQPIENFYMCPDIGGRYAQLATILALRDALRESPLSASALSADLGDLESRITRNDIVDEADVDAYLLRLSDLLLQNGEDSLAEDTNDTWVLRAESLVSMHRAHSGYFNLLTDFVRSRNRVITQGTDIGAPLTPQNIFVARNPFLLFLLAYNERADKELQLLKPIPFNAGIRRLLSYENDLRSAYPPENAAALIIEGKQLEYHMYMYRDAAKMAVPSLNQRVSDLIERLHMIDFFFIDAYSGTRGD